MRPSSRRVRRGNDLVVDVGGAHPGRAQVGSAPMTAASTDTATWPARSSRDPQQPGASMRSLHPKVDSTSSRRRQPRRWRSPPPAWSSSQGCSPGRAEVDACGRRGGLRGVGQRGSLAGGRSVGDVFDDGWWPTFNVTDVCISVSAAARALGVRAVPRRHPQLFRHRLEASFGLCLASQRGPE